MLYITYQKLDFQKKFLSHSKNQCALQHKQSSVQLTGYIFCLDRIHYKICYNLAHKAWKCILKSKYKHFWYHLEIFNNSLQLYSVYL